MRYEERMSIKRNISSIVVLSAMMVSASIAMALSATTAGVGIRRSINPRRDLENA
jgi:hypothetical protein